MNLLYTNYQKAAEMADRLQRQQTGGMNSYTGGFLDRSINIIVEEDGKYFRLDRDLSNNDAIMGMLTTDIEGYKAIIAGELSGINAEMSLPVYNESMDK